LDWERNREYALCRQPEILKEGSAIEQEGGSYDEKFERLLELQNELDDMKWAGRPWILISPEEKALNMIPSHRQHFEPFRLVSEFSRLEHFLLKKSNGVDDRFEVAVDWSKSNKRLVKSFKDAVERLRRTPGTRANLAHITEARGRGRSVNEKLFRLAVWRCWKAAFNASDALRILAPLRPGFGPASKTFLKKYLSLAKEGEELVTRVRRK